MDENINWLERLWHNPWGVTYTKGQTDIIRQEILRLFISRAYDPICNCIERITLIAHNNVGGNIVISGKEDIEFKMVDYNMYKVQLKKDKNATLPPNSQKALDFLDFLSPYMCADNATRDFVQCRAGEGEFGMQLFHFIAGRYPDITIHLYDIAVGYSYTHVVPK